MEGDFFLLGLHFPTKEKLRPASPLHPEASYPAELPMSSQPPRNIHQNVNQNVIVNAPHNTAPGWLARLVYFVFIGWWLSGLCIVTSYGLMVTVIGIPLGVIVLNRLPQITSLRPRSQGTQVTTAGDSTVVSFLQGAPQRNWFVRTAYFLLVGWWLVAVYLTIAWIGTVLTLGWGALVFYNLVPALLTLHRN